MKRRLLVVLTLTLGAGVFPACTCGPRSSVPTVLSVEPAWGPMEGGTAAIVTGENFAPDVVVRFGGAPATDVIRMDSRTISVRTPPGFGMVSVQVENPGNHVGTLDGAFEYRGQIFCTVSATSPVPGDEGVPVVGDLLVEWSHPIDSASLASNVVLERLGPDAADVPAEIDPYGDRAVHVRPAKSLRFWHAYSILVGDGVRDASGQPCAPAAVPFSTVEPTPAPRALLAAPVNGAVLVGDHLIVASRDYRGLQVFNVSDPSLVALSTDMPTKHGPLGLAALGDTAYAPAGWDGVLLFDVTDPSSPAEIGRGGTPGFAADVEPFARAGRTFLAVADGKEGARLLDATDPAHVFSVGVVDPSGARAADVRAVAVQGDVLAIADGVRGVTLVRFTDPDDPATATIVSQFDVGGGLSALDVAWHGTILFVARGYFGVQSYDATDPANPIARDIGYGPGGQCSTGCTDYMSQLVVSGDELYAAAWRPGVFRFTSDGVGGLTLVDNLPVDGMAFASAASPSHVFVGAEEGILVYDRAQVDAAPIWVSPTGHGITRGVAVVDGFAYTASSFRGLQTFSLADPAAPALVDADDTPGMQQDVAAFHVEPGPPGVLILADGRAGVTLFDVTTPDDPVQLSNLSLFDRSSGMDLDGDVLYVCDDNAGVSVVSLADPSSPAEIGFLSYTPLTADDQCYDVLVAGEILYVAGRTHLARADVSNPTAPQWIDSIAHPPGEYTRSIAVSGDYLYSTTYQADVEGRRGVTQRLEVFGGLSGTPSLVWRSDDLGGASSVAVFGDKAFVSAGDLGIHVYDLADPARPVLEGTIETRGNVAMVARGDGALYTASVGGGLETVVTGPLP